MVDLETVANWYPSPPSSLPSTEPASLTALSSAQVPALNKAGNVECAGINPSILHISCFVKRVHGKSEMAALQSSESNNLAPCRLTLLLPPLSLLKNAMQAEGPEYHTLNNRTQWSCPLTSFLPLCGLFKRSRKCEQTGNCSLLLAFSCFLLSSKQMKEQTKRCGSTALVLHRIGKLANLSLVAELKTSRKLKLFKA